MTSPRPVRVDEPHWYLTVYYDGCVLCGGGGRTERIRMPGKRPDDPEDRYVESHYDWACSSHFL